MSANSGGTGRSTPMNSAAMDFVLPPVFVDQVDLLGSCRVMNGCERSSASPMPALMPLLCGNRAVGAYAVWNKECECHLRPADCAIADQRVALIDDVKKAAYDNRDIE